MNDLYDLFLTINKRKYPGTLFSYPCVDPNSAFLQDKNVVIFGNTCSALEEQLIKKCKAKGAALCDDLNDDTDILIINAPFGKNDELSQTEELYFDTLFHYIKPSQKAITSMLKRKCGQIVFVLPPHATIPSVEYTSMAAFAIVGLTKGLALKFAPNGIVINGLVLGDSEDYETIADWVVFLASGNARNIVGELIVLD
jgi:NAD(P)-dependent dehydrogenase (short-subunit alcohol dehydrogenase family)